MTRTDDIVLPASFTDADPASRAVFLDIDGVLAPIVENPADSRVEQSTLELLDRARERVGLLAFVTGRSLADALRLVPLEGVWHAATHGMHMRSPDGEETLDGSAARARDQLDLAVRLAQTVGWRYEDKGQSVTVHFRHAANPEFTARGMRAQMNTVLDPRIVGIHDARMALEVRPVTGRTKADAVHDLLEAAGDGIRVASYTGDDWTDIDAFRALEGSDRAVLRIAVASDEAPAELLELADVVVPGQQQVDELLNCLLT